MEKTLSQQDNNCVKVVLYGPESSGKTTLAAALAEAFHTEWVPEFAREFLQQKWDDTKDVCSLEDLHKIAIGQMEAENKALQKADKVLFCDTNIWVTKVWSETHFDGYSSPQLNQLARELNYDFYLLTSPDIPWVKDDLRDRPHQRESMFDYFEKTLVENHFPYICLKGSHKSRLKQATEAVQNLLKNHYAY